MIELKKCCQCPNCSFRLRTTFPRLAFVWDFGKQMFNLKQKINMETNVQGLDGSPNDAKRVLPAVPIDGDGQVLHEGDRVYSYDYDKNLKPSRCYGTLHKNEDYPEVSEWYIAYDDGQECAVLEMSLVFKA